MNTPKNYHSQPSTSRICTPENEPLVRRNVLRSLDGSQNGKFQLSYSSLQTLKNVN